MLLPSFSNNAYHKIKGYCKVHVYSVCCVFFLTVHVIGLCVAYPCVCYDLGLGKFTHMSLYVLLGGVDLYLMGM